MLPCATSGARHPDIQHAIELSRRAWQLFREPSFAAKHRSQDIVSPAKPVRQLFYLKLLTGGIAMA
jgi:LmbE family N-acetylglucosaminyl deacetylase